MKKDENEKHRKILWPLICVVLAAAVCLAVVFGVLKAREKAPAAVSETEESAETEKPEISAEEFAAYAKSVDEIAIPENASVIALGEATHGNVEFQELKLEVFRLLVEKFGVRAFALEGDFGGCEKVNRFIHGEEGTAEEAAAAIGFAIYRTDEMAELISYMKDYNESAEEGDDLRFYGIDMQRCAYNVQYLTEECRKLGIETGELEALIEKGNWSEEYDTASRTEILSDLKSKIEGKAEGEAALHYADILLQNCQLQESTDMNYNDIRDKFMAENTMWVAKQEKEAGHERIFVSAHNGHVAKYGSYDAMGKLISDEIGDGYFVIGTDFYKTNCNLPDDSAGGRTEQEFFSNDPLAKAAMEAGLDVCWLDFSEAEASEELSAICQDYINMGSLGESYSSMMRLLPASYRLYQPPATLYDGMIFVAEATPTKIKD